MKFLTSTPFALVAAVLATQSPFPGVRSEHASQTKETKKLLRANINNNNNTKDRHGDLARRRTIETGTKTSIQSVTTCSESKTVNVFAFCIMGNHDDGENGEHLLHINGYYDDEIREYKEGECTSRSSTFSPVPVVQAMESLVVGTEEYDGDGTIEEYDVEMTPESWHDGTTCGTYDIALSVQFENGNGVSACWNPFEGAEPRNLDIPRCDVDNYREPDGAFTWYLEIRPEHVYHHTPPPVPAPSPWPSPYPTWEPSQSAPSQPHWNTEPPTTHAQAVHGKGKTDFPPGWTDSLGDTCGWYADATYRCESFSEDYANGHSAATACTACGGGVYANGKVDYPAGWKDNSGDGCDWYAGHPNHCANWGHLESHSGHTAKIACVVCGGGAKMVDSPADWTDDHGDGCDWYENHLQHCNEEGADEACAVCGGGAPKWDYLGWQDSAGDGCDWYVDNGCDSHASFTNDQGLSATAACVVCGGGTLFP